MKQRSAIANCTDDNTELIQMLNKRLFDTFDQDATLGLAKGKIGFCFFAFWMAKHEKNENYRKIAEILLNDVSEKVVTMQIIDLMDGLAGIGLTIRYLLKESYVKGNPNSILYDIDDMIFKQLSYSKSLNNISTLSVIQILFYLYIRIYDQKKGSESEYLYQELIIATVNYIYQKTDASFFEEPSSFNMNYLLPQFLFVLSKIYRLNFYNYRIIKIIEEISLKALSTLPILHANQLYLMWGMDSVLQKVNMKGWDYHIHLLKEHLDIDIIFDDELRSRNIYVDNGFGGIYILLSAMQKYFSKSEILRWMTKIISRIESSDVWLLMEQDPEYLQQNRGLLSGLCGVSMVLADAKSKFT